MKKYQKKGKYVLLILLLVLIAEVIFFGFWLTQSGRSEKFGSLVKDWFGKLMYQETDINYTRDFVQELSGINNSLKNSVSSIPEQLAEELATSRIYLILSNKVERHDDQITQSFVLENGELTRFEDESKDELDFYYSFSQDGQKGAFFGVPRDRRASEESWAERASLYSFDRSAVADSPFPTIERSTDLGNVPFANKQNLTISNAGKVLFTWHADPFGGGVDGADNWSISTVENGQPLFVTYGFMPKWINNEEFVFLKNAGVYKGTFAEGGFKETMLIANTSSNGNSIYNNSRLDVSADGSTIVFVKPEESAIEVYKKSGEGYVLSGTITARGFWAVISPSGSFLALQTIRSSSDGRDDNPEPKIIFFDLRNFEVVEEIVIDLSAFDQLRMFMTEWVKK